MAEKAVLKELLEALKRVEDKISVLAYVKIALIYGLMSIFMIGCIIISTVLGMLGSSLKVIVVSLFIFYVAFTIPAFSYVGKIIGSAAAALGVEYRDYSGRHRIMNNIPWIIAFIIWYILSYKPGYLSFAPGFLVFLAVGNIGNYIYNYKTYKFKANFILVASIALLAIGVALLLLCVETSFLNTPAREGLFIQLSFTTGVLAYISISMYSLHKALHKPTA